MGAELRKAVLDGYPANQVVGCDLLPDFLALGHELWDDKPEDHDTRGGINLIADSALNITPLHTSRYRSEPDSEETAKVTPILPLGNVTQLNDLAGRVRFIFAHHLFHLFDEERQLQLAINLAVLLSRKAGCIIFGGHIGAETKGFVPGAST